MNRNYVYVFRSVNNTCWAVNYSANNHIVNSFLHYFDIWGSVGNFKFSADEIHSEVWFECDHDFYELAQNETMKNAFKKMGVEVVLEAPECAFD